VLPPGIYTWLPLGLSVLRKVEAIIREEMANIGAQEVHFPALLPREPYEATNRWTEYGEGLFRLQDRKGADYLLAPTHEEMFTLLVKDLYSSYKDLPLSLYQIQNKYRDEARPRAGLLRGREFIMKDSYSFDVDDAGLDASYAAHRGAYLRIFERLGLEVIPVTATAGAMGGSKSEEFLHPTDIGEDTFVRSAGGYAANVEAVTTVVPADIDFTNAPAAEVRDTPDTPTIDTLVAAANELAPRSEADGGAWTAADTLKNVVLAVTLPTGERQLVVIGLPGDRGVDLKRVEANIGSFLPIAGEIGLEAANDDDLKKQPLIVKGYLGPGLTLDEPLLGSESATKLLYLVDPRVVSGTAWVTGANDGRQARVRPRGRTRLHLGRRHRMHRRPRRRSRPGRLRSFGNRPRHRDGPHLPAGPQVRRSPGPEGPGPERQAGGGHHGFLRRGRHPRRRSPGRIQP
jgi:prolyl-tRNA synthetase